MAVCMLNQFNCKNMDQKSQMKILAAGFRILRTQDQPKPIIKYKDSSWIEWRTLEKFEAKAARDRRLNELLLDDKTVQDN